MNDVFMTLTVEAEPTDIASLEMANAELTIAIKQVVCFIAHIDGGSHLTLTDNHRFWVKESPDIIKAKMTIARYV